MECTEERRIKGRRIEKSMSIDTSGRAAGCGGVHARLLEDLDQLAPEGGDVLLDFVYVILSDTFILRLSLFHCHVSPH